MKTKSLAILFLFGLSACAPQDHEAINKIATNTTQDISCKSSELESRLWDGLKEYLIQEEKVLSADSLKEVFHQRFRELQAKNPQTSLVQFRDLQNKMDNLIDTLLGEAPQGERATSSSELLILLSAMDVGDQSTPFRAYIQPKVRQQLSDLQLVIQKMNLGCENSDSSNNQTNASEEMDPIAPVEVPPQESALAARDFEYHKRQALKAGFTLASFGAQWTLATAYQSCQATILPSMNSQTPSVEGIEEVGRHPDGVGKKRKIASLSDVVRTHYYVRDNSRYSQGCFDLRTSPLIYDYGGKPYATTATSSPIDLFKNNGDGTSVLGIDCSGYVFTAMASSGLRLKKGRALKASDSWAWGSSSYVEPQNNGLTCLNKVSVTPTASLKSGDIVAVYGHVVIIERAGKDPFGLSRAQTVEDCSSLKASGFDFTVAQSSPSKSAIGINFYEARDYLPTSAKMKSSLEKYAYYACLAKFNNKTYTPNLGTSSVVRHSGTESCMAPRVSLSRESCVASCGSLLR